MAGRRDATAWLRVLDTFGSSDWEVSEIALVDSFLGEAPRGRARHEVVARVPLGVPPLTFC
jgi:2'-5' RNA ligase